MPEPIVPGANGDGSAAPAPDSPAGSEPQAGAPPDVGGNQAPPQDKPFHEREDMKYLIRQIGNIVREQMVQPGANGAPVTGTGYSPAAAPASDELVVVATKLAARFNMDPEAAKELVGVIDGIASARAKPAMVQLENFELQSRFGALFARTPDAQQYTGKMKELFDGLSEYERNFVLKSPDGPGFLYDKAKRSSGGGIATPDQRNQGSSPVTRGGSPALKLGGSGTLFQQANEALRKGDRASYEKTIADIARSK